ncbi:MAG: class I SAM-dependent methyltransferase [Saprospiraceae bacterium]|nr:class I SAM-dependent methyltransferase [Saprospiraceae bacterium]
MSKNSIEMLDYGQGRQSLKTERRSISGIAFKSLSNKVKCRILFNLVNQYKTQHILELGTSLGISSSYLASANGEATVISLDGDPSVVQIAREVHQNLGLKNIEVIEGPFNETLIGALKKIQTVDLAFLDGHHQKKSTLEYYDNIYPYCHQNSIIVVDDIYWSEDMNEAWNILTSKPEVMLSIDLFDVGILFFKKELSKMDVSYISYKYKPWKIGLFG